MVLVFKIDIYVKRNIMPNCIGELIIVNIFLENLRFFYGFFFYQQVQKNNLIPHRVINLRMIFPKWCPPNGFGKDILVNFETPVVCGQNVI